MMGGHAGRCAPRDVELGFRTRSFLWGGELFEFSASSRPWKRFEAEGVSFQKKSLICEFFLVCSISIKWQEWAFRAKNILTYPDGSDNQKDNPVSYVYNSKFGSPVAGRWGLIEGGFGYG